MLWILHLHPLLHANSPHYDNYDGMKIQVPACLLVTAILLQHFGHLIWRDDSLEKTLMLGKTEGRNRRGALRMRCLDGNTNSSDMSLSKFRETVKDREAWRATVCGVAKSRTRLGNWTTTAVLLLSKGEPGVRCFYNYSCSIPDLC